MESGHRDIVGEINKEIEEREKGVEMLENEVVEMKKREVKRLVKDYLNPGSSLRKIDVNLKQLFLCLFGDTAWEVEFLKELKIAEKSFKNRNIQLPV